MSGWSRRRFLQWSTLVAAGGAIGDAGVAVAAAPLDAGYARRVILVELKGGNDGLNTLVPFADDAYYALRPRIAVPRDGVMRLSDRVGLNPALAALRPLWERRELAVLQGVGYPDPNLSHFRSIEIWDTASRSSQYLESGWLARTFGATPTPKRFAADGCVIGSNDMGPLAGGGSRAIALADTGQFVRRARLVHAESARGNATLMHVLKTESDIVGAASRLAGDHAFATAFPATAFGHAVGTACQVAARRDGVAAIRITQNGYDTHRAQVATQTRLLQELGDGLVALRSALIEIDRWNDTLILTYAEFGRRPQENASGGTDHGTASVHFALGGRVSGGLYGETPSLARLHDNANVGHALDFRAVYATVLERWWGLDAGSILGERFAPIPYVRT